MDKNKYTLGERNITVYRNYDGENFIYLCESHADDEMIDKIASRLKKLTGKTPWSLVIFDVDDWNNSLSPWKGKNSKDEEVFGGNGEDTLSWIKNSLIPFCEENMKAESRYIAGYSLAGLFSLWAFYESDMFDGAASCSGSLWFDGWEEYIKNVSAGRTSKVYLSLGMKEEKTNDRLMSTVGNMTRLTYEHIKNDENITASALVMNPGGHFTEPENRIANAITYLVKGE